MSVINKIIDRFKRKYISLKHTKRMIVEMKENEILINLKKKISAIDKSIPLGTSSWEKNRREIRKQILEKNVADFLNWEVIQKTMSFEAPRTEYEDIEKNSLIMKSIKESKIGNPKPYYLNTLTSGNLIHHAYSLNQFLKEFSLNDIERVVEFGGGYGSMCRLIRNIGYENEYLIFDLPEFSSLQEFFLNSINTEYTKNTVLTGDMDKLNSDKKTLFIATWSFSEMPLVLREELLNNLNFNYCLIAFQSDFDGIDNVEYFKNFTSLYANIEFKISPIKHLPGHFYLIGVKK